MAIPVRYPILPQFYPADPTEHPPSLAQEKRLWDLENERRKQHEMRRLQFEEMLKRYTMESMFGPSPIGPRSILEELIKNDPVPPPKPVRVVDKRVMAQPCLFVDVEWVLV